MKDKRYDFNPFAGTLFDNQHAYADRSMDVSGPGSRTRGRCSGLAHVVWSNRQLAGVAG